MPSTLNRVRTPAHIAFLAMIGMIGVLLGFGTPASAHTGFESSDPADGVVLAEPVEVVTITFTGDATPVGDQFVALNAAGELQAPVEFTTEDDRVFVLRFDPPLAGGAIGIRWNVKAADAHPIDGAFSFTVEAPFPASATAQVDAVAEADAGAVSTDEAALPPDENAAAVPVDDAAAEPDPVATAASSPSATVGDTDSDAVAAPTEDGDDGAIALDDFLATESAVPGETTATIGRVVGLIGAMVGLGMLAFIATTLRGARTELSRMLTTARCLGLVMALGAAIEYVGVTRIAGDALSGTWSTSPGFATALRFAGGIAIAVGVGGALVRIRPQAPAQSLSAMVLDPEIESSQRTESATFRWRPDRDSLVAATGSLAVIASFWFDGHTVSKGLRPLHALANSLHLVAGAVWVGGVVSIAAVLWMRTRSGERLRGTEMVVRFSKLATIALAGVVLAGMVMAVLVLDSFSELTSTEWGQILLLKTTAVALAMLAGAYNHFRLLPALEADPESTDLLADLRGIVTAEAIVLLFVVMVTGWLVAAAS